MVDGLQARDRSSHSTIIQGSLTSCRPERVVTDGAKNTADDRANHRHPGVTPVGIALARDWQQEMRQPRTEVARGIDGVTRRATERQTYGPDQYADEKRR